MQFKWILVLFAIISASCCSQANASRHAPPPPTPPSLSQPPADKRDIERLWAAALRAINEAELQRRGARPASFEPMPRPARLNSKRLQWRTNSKHLVARRASRQIEAEAEAEEQADSLQVEPRTGTYASSQANNVNPSYLDVRDYTPAPPTWWF
ncbi:hypothetical protein KR222_009674 [Zaprionus bogoriensis]|nr:hypothetical protein KR222_009674 [Zaprionus bogoriensis]